MASLVEILEKIGLAIALGGGTAFLLMAFHFLIWYRKEITRIKHEEDEWSA